MIKIVILFISFFLLSRVLGLFWFSGLSSAHLFFSVLDIACMIFFLRVVSNSQSKVWLKNNINILIFFSSIFVLTGLALFMIILKEAIHPELSIMEVFNPIIIIKLILPFITSYVLFKSIFGSVNNN